MSELREQIQPLLVSYRQFHLHEHDIEAGDREHFEVQSKLAWDTFLAMFRGRLGGRGFLLGDEEDSIVETLMNWAEELRPANTAAMTEGLSLEQCSALLSNLSSDSAEGNAPASWPYIKKIQYELRIHLSLLGHHS